MLSVTFQTLIDVWRDSTCSSFAMLRQARGCVRRNGGSVGESFSSACPAPSTRVQTLVPLFPQARFRWFAAISYSHSLKETDPHSARDSSRLQTATAILN